MASELWGYRNERLQTTSASDSVAASWDRIMNLHKNLPAALLGILVFALMPMAFANAQQVSVTSADPSSTLQGTLSLDVTVNGNGFDSTAKVQFFVTGTTNPGGITVKKVSVRGAKKLIATIDVADAAAVSKFDIEVSLSNGRKGKGTTLFSVQAKANDACMTAVGFPAFIYVKQSGQVGTYVADVTGKCSRFLSGGLPSATRFSYPVKDDLGVATNRGRVVWRGRDPNAPITYPLELKFYAMDFTVTGTNIVAGPAHLIVNFGLPSPESSGNPGACCGLDLSRDGRDIYLPAMAELRPEGYVHSVVRMRLPANLDDLNSASPPAPVTVFEHQAFPTDYVQYTGDISVNAGGDLLFISQRYSSESYRLLGVDLDVDLTDTAGNPEVTVLFDPTTSTSYTPILPRADTSSAASDLLAVAYYSFSEGCERLVIMNGRTGTVLNEGSQWPAWVISWSGGKVLSRGFRNGCRSTDTMVEIDPTTGATAPLLTGDHPDGR